MSGLQATSEPWKRAARRPDKVLNAIKMLLTRGVDETVNIVRGQISAGSILGYSAAGTVVGLGAGVEDIEIGDRVACAGAQSALRCYRPAGVRRAEPTLGETFVVVGLGLIGQLTAQMLKANGCRVISIDLDPRRVELAKSKPRKSPSRWNRPYRRPPTPSLVAVPRSSIKL
jgi:D-arabinose 1-dehydrogenase-like Zn-dependent alcohol dehydrogenase